MLPHVPWSIPYFCISDEMKLYPDLLEFISLKWSRCSTCQRFERKPLKAMSHPIDVWCSNAALSVGGMLTGVTYSCSPRHWFIPINRVPTRLGLPLCNRSQSVMIFASSLLWLVATGHVNTLSVVSDSLPHFIGKCAVSHSSISTTTVPMGINLAPTLEAHCFYWFCGAHGLYLWITNLLPLSLLLEDRYVRPNSILFFCLLLIFYCDLYFCWDFLS